MRGKAPGILFKTNGQCYNYPVRKKTWTKYIKWIIGGFIGFALLGLILASSSTKPLNTTIVPTVEQARITSTPAVTNNPFPTQTTTPTTHINSLDSSQCHAIQISLSDLQAFLPDPSCTPGEIDPAVTQNNIATTICSSGYTQTVRPSVSYTNALKKQQIIDYGYTDTKMSDYEEDHFISLELGGSPKDPRNLWPEPHSSPNEKDKVENYLHSQVCSGKLSLLQAQREITDNWYEIYRNMASGN